MTILILDENHDYTRVLDDVLTGMGFSVRVSRDARELVSVAQPDDVILATARADLDPIDALMRELRRDIERVRTAVLIIADDKAIQDPALNHLVARFRNATVMRRGASLLDLGDRIREIQRQILSQPPQSESTTNESIATMFQLFGAIWCQEESGTLTAADGRAGQVSKGAAVDTATTELIEACLEGRTRARFERTPQRGGGDSSTLGRMLWAYGGRHASANFALSRLEQAIQPVLWVDRISDLPVQEDVPRLVGTADGQATLRTQLTGLRVDPGRVGRDLSILSLMGLIKLAAPIKAEVAPQLSPPSASAGRASDVRTIPPPEPTTPRPSASRTAPTSSDNTPRPPASQATGATPKPNDVTDGLLMLKRLRKEAQRLAQTDAWTVLGLAPTREPEAVRVAARRLRERYEAIAQERRDSDEIGRLCRALVAQIVDAEGRALRRVSQISEAATMSDEERMFVAGKEAAQGGRWSLAVRAFRTVHKLRIDSPLYQAWLGWAIFNDTTRADSRVDEALEFLELADSFQSDLAEGQLFLARVELHAGRYGKAHQRLERLAKLHPNTDGLEQALRLARDKVSTTQPPG